MQVEYNILSLTEEDVREMVKKVVKEEMEGVQWQQGEVLEKEVTLQISGLGDSKSER